MDSFSLWHWLVVLLAVVLYLLLIGRGQTSPRKTLLSLALLFVAGAVTSALAVIVGQTVSNGGDLSDVLNMVQSRLALYLGMSLLSGLVWVLLGLAIARLPAPEGVAGWVGRVVAVTILMGPFGRVIGMALQLANGTELPPWSVLQDPTFWFGYLVTPPYNIIAFVRGAILVALAIGVRDGGFGRARRWAPVSLAASGPDQATRILCGNALLAGSGFRRSVLGFFEEKWTATAPEFGLDIRLLATVCSYAEKRDKAYGLIFAAIAMVGAVAIAVAPEIGPLLIVLVAGGVWFAKWNWELALARGFSQASFTRAGAAARFGDGLDPRIAHALPRQDQNLIVYRGFTPFVGAGIDLGGWSFVTFVDKPKVKGAADKIRPFTIRQLYAALDASMNALRLPGLSCRDYFFVRGLDIKGDSEILSDPGARPRQLVSPDLATSCLEEQDPRVRNYKCIQILDWGGEIVVSYFLRCSLQGKSLLVEMKRYLLPPLSDEHRRVDRLGPDRIGQRIGRLIVSLVAGPLFAVVASFIVLATAQEAMARVLVSEGRRARYRRRLAENDPSYDYGAETTLRARLAQNSFLHYFQKSDADLDNKLIERKILDEIEGFLDENGIDTTDIRDRQTTILNSGILVQGGDVRAESLAVGQGAQATKVEGQKPAQSRPAKETVA